MTSRLWIDANIILRFLTGEPQEFHARAERLMERAERGEVLLFVDDLVLAEVVWVLKSYYKRPMSEISEVLSAFLAAPGIDSANQGLLVQALQLASEKNVDFVDGYLALRASGRGDEVCTFDKTDFRRLPGRWSSPT